LQRKPQSKPAPPSTCDLSSQFWLMLGDGGEEAFTNHLLLHLKSISSW